MTSENRHRSKRTQIMELNKKPKISGGGDVFKARLMKCKNLRFHYDLPPEEKRKFVQTEAAMNLFQSLPKEIGRILMRGFQLGLSGQTKAGRNKVAEYFNEKSLIIPELMDNPGTYSMLERVYTRKGISGAIDSYFHSCLAGQALRNRLRATIAYSKRHLDSLEGQLLVLNFGSGSARDTLTLSKENQHLAKRIRVDCIDIDSKANERGMRIANELGIKNHRFIERNMLKLRNEYRATADFGLLIGILCPLDTEMCIQILKIIRRYFKKGAQIISACLLQEMLERDLLCAYILREITGWELMFRKRGELKRMYLEAGYKWGGSFSDSPTNFYEIGIGIV